jgi:hypothetical protein
MGVKLVSHLKGIARIEGFENRVLRKIFGPKRDEVTRGWGKLPNEELLNLCSSVSIMEVTCSKLGRDTGFVVVVCISSVTVMY